MPLAERFDCFAEEIRRTRTGIAEQLAEAICAWRFEANQHRETFGDFERGRDLDVPPIAAR